MRWENMDMEIEMTGERLLEFLAENKIYLCSTQFQQKNCRKWVWASPDGKHWNMIEVITIDERWKTAGRNCRPYHGADITSDHSLVLAKVQTRHKIANRVNHNKQKPGLDSPTTKEMQQNYSLE